MNFLTDLLLHNEIINMYGPHFIVVYTIFLVLICFTGYLVRRNFENKYDQPEITNAYTNFYFIIYLKSGLRKMIETIASDLYRKGYFLFSNHVKHSFVVNKAKSDNKLDDVEKIVFNLTKQAGDLKNIFQNPDHVKKVDSDILALMKKEGYDKLIHHQNKLRNFHVAATFFQLVFLSLGLYKLTFALLRGHYNVILLLITMPVGVLFIKLILVPRQLAKTGIKYVSKKKKLDNNPNYKPMRALIAALFAPSVFGLKGKTGDKSNTERFYSGGETGAGCGGSGCGSGCGGACGGCGG